MKAAQEAVARGDESCLWCGAPSTLRSEAVLTYELLYSIGEERRRGELFEVRSYLSREVEPLPFGACEACLKKKHRRRLANLAAIAAGISLCFGFGGFAFSLLFVRKVYPPWNLPEGLDIIVGGLAALAAMAILTLRGWSLEAELMRSDRGEWAARLAKRTLARRERAMDRELRKRSSGNMRVVVYAPKEYATAKATGEKPI